MKRTILRRRSLALRPKTRMKISSMYVPPSTTTVQFKPILCLLIYWARLISLVFTGNASLRFWSAGYNHWRCELWRSWRYQLLHGKATQPKPINNEEVLHRSFDCFFWHYWVVRRYSKSSWFSLKCFGKQNVLCFQNVFAHIFIDIFVYRANSRKSWRCFIKECIRTGTVLQQFMVYCNCVTLA